MEVDLGGSGKVNLAETGTEQKIDLSGSSGDRAGNLETEPVDLTISGSGDAVIWVIESLHARVSGSGSVE